MGYIDHRGQWAIEPKYGVPVPLGGIVYPRDFSEGLAVVSDRETGGDGFLDPNGNWVIGPELISASFFHDGVAVVERREYEYEKEPYSAQLIDQTDRRLTPERDREWILRHIDLSTLR